MAFILDIDDPVTVEKLGAKAAALADLQRAGLPVPAWFVLSPDAFDASAGADVGEVTPCDEVRAALADALATLCPNGEAVAVRSSMPDEDGLAHSFAGQFESYLGVAPDAVADRVADVWRSAFAGRVAHYRSSRGATTAPPAPAVLVQRMVDAEAAGVAFSADPASGQRGVAVVAAVRGLACGLVSGECDADEYRVDRTGRIVSYEIAKKRVAYYQRRGAHARVEALQLPRGEACRPSLWHEQACAVAELARRCERHSGLPQDIEWAFTNGTLYLLQSRPITSLARLPDPDGKLAVWDNSNIAESYTGVTTPLTFSFVRYAYAHVYRELCRIGGVDESTIAANETALRSMIGLVRGRIYYNLLSWYQLLALTPGFRYNRSSLDRMLGLRDEVAEEALEGLDCRPESTRLRRTWSMARVVASVVRNQATIERRVARFNRRVDVALAPSPITLEALRPDELVAHWHDLVRKLLKRWDAPLVNDYLAMFFHGALGRLVERWFPESDRGLANRLLQGERNVISVEPAMRLLEMADLARTRRRWSDLLREAPLHVIDDKMDGFPELRTRYRAYLDQFGDRCLEELKLESPTLHDDPSPLLRSIGELARTARRDPSDDPDPRSAAERRVREVLRASPLRRALFGWILHNARARVRDRENLRFERTRVFGRVRRIFVELGKRLHALGLLTDPSDVFYLEVDEILGFVDGTATCTDLRGLAALRRAEFARYHDMEAPGDRFETRGVVHHAHDFRESSPSHTKQEGETRSGQPCSSGRVRGRVRVVEDPRTARLGRGEILVAERTDPGWVVLFSGAAGLLVERGSLLSHTAIVARELGIPAVIGVDGACTWLDDGDMLEIDGDSGVVQRLASDDEARAA